MPQFTRGRDEGEGEGTRAPGDMRPDPIAAPVAPAPQPPAVGTPPAPAPGEAPPESPAPKPVLPPGASSATPLGAGTFQLPGQGLGSTPFRTMDFWSNRFVGGPGVEEAQRPENMIGATPGGNPNPRPLDPETLRRIFGGALRGGGTGGY